MIYFNVNEIVGMYNVWTPDDNQTTQTQMTNFNNSFLLYLK